MKGYGLTKTLIPCSPAPLHEGPLRGVGVDGRCRSQGRWQEGVISLLLVLTVLVC